MARDGATFLLNSPYGPEQVWDELPGKVRRQIQDKHVQFWIVDANKVAAEAQLGSRINTVMQPCFFALSGILPVDKAVAEIKAAVTKAYGKRGQHDRGPQLRRHRRCARRTSSGWRSPRSKPPPARSASRSPTRPPNSSGSVTSMLMDGKGDLLPVSALPADGRFPSGTTRFEKRAIALEMPIWDPDICIDCGKCTIVCPHAVIRMKVFTPDALAGAPQGFLSKPFRSKDLPGHEMAIAVAVDDCTGCGVCVDVCPAKSKTEASTSRSTWSPRSFTETD